MKDHPISLAKQLVEVAKVIEQVEAGFSGSEAMLQIKDHLRPGVQAICFAVWRNWEVAQAIKRLLARKGVADTWLDALLSSALALLMRDELIPHEAQYDAHTLVNQAVEAAKLAKLREFQCKFVNGCLRRALREKGVLLREVCSKESIRWNFPQWWIDKLKTDWPDDWQDILAQSNVHPAMTLRVNRRVTTSQAYQARLNEQGIEFRVTNHGAIVLHHGVAVTKLPDFEKGAVSVQDAAAQLAAPLLLSKIERPQRILDACAAPGGKIGHLLELTSAHVTALEIDKHRAEKIKDNLKRLGLRADVRVGSVLEPQTWWDGQLFDAILLDAPCSASGIVRRHPDIRRLRRPTDIVQLAEVQQAMLRTLWPLLDVNGFLLYCTCSVFKNEGEEQTQAFIQGRSDTKLWESVGHLLPSHDNGGGDTKQPFIADNDGFYFALFQKIAV